MSNAFIPTHFNVNTGELLQISYERQGLAHGVNLDGKVISLPSPFCGSVLAHHNWTSYRFGDEEGAWHAYQAWLETREYGAV